MASAKSAKKSDVDVKQEDVIIAVLIADSFSTRFSPITIDKPKVYFHFLKTFCGIYFQSSSNVIYYKGTSSNS